MTDKTYDKERANPNDQPIQSERSPFVPIVLERLSQLPKHPLQMIAASDFEAACKEFNAKFRRIGGDVYCYQKLFFFPLDGGE